MKSDFKSFLSRYKGRIAGVLIAAAICVLIFTIGFWATLLISVVVAAGYFIGKAADNGNSMGERVAELIERRLPSGRK